jgi:TetR/AcrR family transcriptional regulator, regulator of cefoperazone and chloramphenicol sensitivity
MAGPSSTKQRSKRRPAYQPSPISEPADLDPKRAKLLEAASEIFAERGFHAATVREICVRAGANVAAINYYFGDKMGLYTEVLRRAVSGVGHSEVGRVFARGAPPDRLLREVIKIMIRGLYGRDRPALPFRLMRHELARPTPALPQVIDEIMRPNYDHLRATIGAMLGLPAEHETTRLCVHSIIGQVLFYPNARPILAHVWPELTMTPAQVDRIAEHIADFSLAYVRAKGGHR